MFVLGNLLFALARVTDMVLGLYSWVLIIWVIISWVNPDPFNPVVQFLRSITEPVLSHIRRFVPPLGFLDLSVIVAFLLIVFLRAFVVTSLYDLSRALH